MGLETVRVPQLSGAATSRRSGPRAATAATALLQPARLRAASRGLAAAAGLFADVAVGPGDHFEPLVGDRIAADDRDAVLALLQTGLGLLDRLEGLLEILAQGAIGTRLLELVGLIAGILGLVSRAAAVL